MDTGSTGRWQHGHPLSNPPSVIIVVTMAAQAAVPDDATLIQTINATFQLFDKAKNGSCDERDVTTIIQALGLNPGVETADRLLEEMRKAPTLAAAGLGTQSLLVSLVLGTLGLRCTCRDSHGSSCEPALGFDSCYPHVKCRMSSHCAGDQDNPSQFIKRERFESVMLRVMKFQNDKAAEIPKDSEETILRAFQALDKDNKGYLEPDELREFMTVKARNPFSAEEFENMLNAAQDPETESVFYEDYAEVLAGKTGPGSR